MNIILEDILIEKFISKAQQKFFFSRINDKNLSKKERKKWETWAKEFSDKTNFKKLPEKKVEEDIDEIVDITGNIGRSKKPSNLNTKGITSNSTTDEFVRTSTGQMGNYFSRGGVVHNKFWTESDLTKVLGFNATIAKDIDYDEAEEYFKNKLDIEKPEEKMSQLGYDKELPEGKINLIEKLIDEILKENEQFIKR
jgi:hypothetical protein